MIERLTSGLRPLDAAIVLVSTIAVCLSIVHWNTIYADQGHVVPTIVASVLGSWLALLLVRLRIGASASFLVAILSTLVGVAAWSAAAIGDLPTDLVESWKALASTGLLIPASRTFILPPVIVSALGAWLTTDIAIRRRAGAAVVLPLAAVHGTAVAYTIGQGPSPWWYAVAVGVASLALVALGAADRPLTEAEHRADNARSDLAGVPAQDHTAIRGRQLLKALPIIAALGLGAVAVNQALVDRDETAYDLREQLVRPLEIFESSTPLARVKAGLVAATPAEVFTTRVVGLNPGDSISLIPVAVLDQYDGAVWTSTARFEASGATLPLPTQSGANKPTSVSVAVELTSDYPFRFLPRVGTVLESGEGEIGWDPRAGSIARVDDARQELRFVTTQVLDAREITPTSSVEDAPSNVRYAAEPPALTDDQVPIFEDFLSAATVGAGTELERLQILEETLRSDSFGYNEDSPAGHSLAAIASYLRPADEAGDAGTELGGVGFSEQSASTFAIAARQLGIPSRVVVGYRLPTPLTVEADQATVTEDMIHAWPEVWIMGQGWTAFEPTNDGNVTDDQTARTPAVSSEGEQAQITDLPELQEPILIPEPATGGRSLAAWSIPILVVILPLLYLLVVIGGKRLRRSRRKRAADPSKRAIGAWLETRERLMSLGLPADRAFSLMDTAEELDLRDLSPVGNPVAAMAGVVDQALYSTAAPSSDAAALAWTNADEAVKAARRSQSARTRLKAAVDPRSLVSR